MTMPTPTPLTPDDEQMRVTVSANRRQLDVEQVDNQQPYGLAAAILALWLLLPLRATRFPVWLDLAVAALLGVFSYFRFRGIKLEFRTDVLSILAAPLGLLYGLPYNIVFHASGNVGFLLCGLTLAVLAGALIGTTGEDEVPSRYPIAASFLSMFVLGNLITLLLPYVVSRA